MTATKLSLNLSSKGSDSSPSKSRRSPIRKLTGSSTTEHIKEIERLNNTVLALNKKIMVLLLYIYRY
jgi:hypothetical protein